jgi:hypothetical protein
MNQVFDQVTLLWQRLAVGGNFREPSTREHDIQPRDMIPRGAVHQGMRAAGIVRDHSANRRPRAGGHIRSETKSVRMQKMIQLIEDDSCADVHRAALQINVRDLLVVTREINDQPLAESASSEAGTRAAWNDGNARLARGLDNGASLFRAPGKSDSQGLDLIDGSVSRIQLPREIVEGDLAIHRRERRDLLSGSHRVFTQITGDAADLQFRTLWAVF